MKVCVPERLGKSVMVNITRGEVIRGDNAWFVMKRATAKKLANEILKTIDSMDK